VAAMPNVVLHVAEAAFGDRPFEVTSSDCPTDYQFRTGEELWLKENLLNLAVARFPSDWQYGAVWDADFHFSRHDLALETIQQLQHYDWVQCFSSFAGLGASHQLLGSMPSLAAMFLSGQAGSLVASAYGSLRTDAPSVSGAADIGATGGAWAFTRDAWNRVGGLLDTCILGSADWFMALALIGKLDHPHPEMRTCHEGYRRSILAWQRRAHAATQFNVGCVEGFAVHHFHGSIRSRGYGTRWEILRDHQFDPTVDVYRDWQGLLQLTPNKPAMRDAIRAYFRSRNEDGE
jgi:hypothetical protein